MTTHNGVYCTVCVRPSLGQELCFSCVVEVSKVQREADGPLPIARCGHPSTNSFNCAECLEAIEKAEDMDSSFVRQVTNFDLSRLGAKKTRTSHRSRLGQGGGAWRMRDKWQASVTVEGKRRYLGTFTTKEEAENAYRAAIIDVQNKENS